MGWNLVGWKPGIRIATISDAETLVCANKVTTRLMVHNVALAALVVLVLLDAYNFIGKRFSGSSGLPGHNRFTLLQFLRWLASPFTSTWRKRYRVIRLHLLNLHKARFLY